MTVRPVAFAEYERLVPALCALLAESVANGAFLGFVAPVVPHESRAYWLSLRPELQVGSRLLVAAFIGDQPVGCGQLALAPWPNARHRADIQKVFVAQALRGHGVGEALMEGLHDAARRLERTLIVLSTQHGGAPVRFYRRLGYREVGVIPGFMSGADGQRHGNLVMYRDLAEA